MLLGGCLLVPGNSVHADALPEGQKQIDSFIKLEGWETVEDWIIVQPTYSEWSACLSRDDVFVEEHNDSLPDADGIVFQLVNDGSFCNFGRWSHCIEYYDLVAINRQYQSDISVAGEFETNSGDIDYYYSVPCDSKAYEKAAIATTAIPLISALGQDMVEEDDPLISRDYIVTFAGVDPASYKLLLSVSDPILRYEGAEAEAFVQSLDYDRNTLSLEAAESTPITGSVTNLDDEGNDATNILGSSWVIIAAISVGLMAVVALFMVSKKSRAS
jgi:hypothetical protein